MAMTVAIARTIAITIATAAGKGQQQYIFLFLSLCLYHVNIYHSMLHDILSFGFHHILHIYISMYIYMQQENEADFSKKYKNKQ